MAMGHDNDRQRTVDLADRSLSGDELRELCCEDGGALVVRGGRVTSELDLADARLGRRLGFDSTVFDGLLNLGSSACRGLELTGCELRGGLDASAARIDGNLTITDCRIPGTSEGLTSTRPSAVWLTDAEITGRLVVAGTELGADDDRWPRSVHADRIKVGASLMLTDGVVARGEVKLTGAEVGGSVLVYGASIEDPYVALYLSEAVIGANLSIMDDRSGRCSRIDGGLVLSGCSVAGQFLVHRAEIRAPSQSDNPRYRYRGARSGVAVDATRARFDGDLRLYGDTTVAGEISLTTATVESQLDLDATVIGPPDGGWGADSYALDLGNATLGSDVRFHGRCGSIRMENATVAGSVHFERLAISANQPEGIEARNVRVEGDVWLDEAAVDGGDIDFRLSHISGDWRAPGARLDATGAEDDYVLTLTSTEVDGSVFINRGFTSTGLIRLNRCRIGGRLAVDGAVLRPVAGAPSPLVVACRSASVASGMFLDWDIDGAVDFHGTETNLLFDNPDRWGRWYIIGGLSYRRMRSVGGGGSGSSDQEVERRLAWLDGQQHPDPGTYSQLADHYRRHGRTLDAERVLMARNRFLRAERRSQGGWRNRARNMADVAWDIGVGYGYRASRAAIVLVALIALTAVILAGDFARERMVAVDEDNVVHAAAETCDSGTVRCYNPAFYAVDTVVPLVDLQQRSTWYVTRARPRGSVLDWGLNVAVLLGWAASSALVLGLTRTLTPEQ